jgi:hypothetical protein
MPARAAVNVLKRSHPSARASTCKYCPEMPRKWRFRLGKS